jgi:hypothetical protein
MVPFGFVKNAKAQTPACSLQEVQGRRANKDGKANLQQGSNFPTIKQEQS